MWRREHGLLLLLLAAAGCWEQTVFLELLEWAGLRVEEGAWAAAAGERKLHGA